MDKVVVKENTYIIPWINVAKGITIFLVVLGHIIQSIQGDYTGIIYYENFLHHIIYSFHMAAFFFLSGFVLTEKSLSIIFKKFCLRKSRTLLIPYVIFSLLMILEKIIMEGGKLSSEWLSENKIIATFLCLNGSIVDRMWFLPCLFATLVLIKVVIIIPNERFRTSIVFILVYISIILGKYNNVNLPLYLENAFYAIGYVYLGFYVRKIKYKISTNYIKLKFATAIFIGLNYVSYYVFGFKSDMFYCIEFESMLLTILTSLLGIFILASISVKFERSKLFAYIGKNSLYIYGFHYFIFWRFCKYSAVIVNNNISFIYLCTIIVFILTVASSLIFSEFIKVGIRVLSRVKNNKIFCRG